MFVFSLQKSPNVKIHHVGKGALINPVHAVFYNWLNTYSKGSQGETMCFEACALAQESAENLAHSRTLNDYKSPYSF